MFFPNQLYPDGIKPTQHVDVIGSLMAMKAEQQAREIKGTSPPLMPAPRQRGEPQYPREQKPLRQAQPGSQHGLLNRALGGFVGGGTTAKPPATSAAPVPAQQMMPQAPQGYFANPQLDQNTLQKLQRMYGSMQPEIGYGDTPYQFPRATPMQGLGTWASHAVTSPQIGVRAFARKHGIEDLLGWDEATRGVTLGGLPVDYSFGYQGRTYADLDVLLGLLKQIQQQQRMQGR